MERVAPGSGRADLPMSKRIRSHRTSVLGRLGVLLAMAAPLSAMAQGTIYFSNRAGPEIDAPVTYLDGTRVGAGFTAQLFGGPKGTPLMSLEPWFPTAQFYQYPPGLGYVQPGMHFGIVETPLPFGAEVSVVMRVFDGPTWEASTCR